MVSSALYKRNTVWWMRFNFHFHDLRHTFATRLVQSGIDLYKVQCLLGHKSPIMTQRYAHHYPESLREGVEMLEKYRLASTGGTNLVHMAQTAGPNTGDEWCKLLIWWAV